jgi:hypothetical protein
MGTSVNQPSANTLPWQAVSSAYRNEAVPVDRVLKEIWRAARSEPGADIRDLLSSRGILICLKASLESSSPEDALSHVTTKLAEQKASSIASEIGKRAAILSARHSERLPAFVNYLFEQTTNYLVSRDLPSYIGAHWRNKTMSAAMHFKDQLRIQTTEIVRTIDLQHFSVGGGAWKKLVANLVERLAS